MKLFTYYTDSHLYLYENFLKKTVDKFKEYELVSGVGYQHCHDGAFNSENFSKTCFEKVKFLLDSNEWESNEVSMFCDVDIVFLNYTKEFLLQEMNDLDMAFQSDGGTCNLGLYLFRKNNRVKFLLENILKIKDGYHNSQLALHAILGNHNIKYKLLDERIWNVNFQGFDPWDGNAIINFPNNILMFHANYMLGVENKIKALNLACNKFLK